MARDILLQQLSGFLNQYVSLTDVEFEMLVEVADFRNIKKRQLLVDSLHAAKEMAFFAKGCFRFFHYLEDGTEVTSDFYFAPGFVTSFTSFVSGKPTNVNVQAMTDMEVLSIERKQLLRLYDDSHNIERVGRILTEQFAMNSELHLFSLLNYPAERRYLELFEQHPEYINQIPLKYLASYLGIKQETLSRIRKKLLRK
ncbi:MAG TPA: Crp/Fnr family transcriptional regulator [Salinivirga sp.]|uniref:Crp/Fnr family transcriptional regulator n=1 Tax=Salinivirga sp. TaxID=1970192 RepID=UPI002B489EA1|nr:Crp/Fnr family transcriptional regulator [Salinivirga sp.]HKK58293.1 Crp/Fnr family transcriptional regulator [Salinivirga sp.]